MATGLATAVALVGAASPAFADSTGTVTAGQGNYSYINERSGPHLSSSVVGQANVGSTVNMRCQTQGDSVENDARWIWSGSFYIADAFIAENTDSLPTCGGAVTLNISMQKQVQDEWCWDASGLTLADYWGYTQYSQYDFCNLAHQYSGVSCNDQPATLDDMAGALWEMGFANTGYDLNRSATFAETTNEISNNRPFAVRIGWAAGGGHMNVIYGYDPSSNMIAVGDPWPSTQTYTWWNYGSYASNSSFTWTHSRIGIHN
ncbi:C39 family peptidase [Kitasatospora sp. RB6PN24]|uniref:papain-like cysteine protease family protein n=1 Tax=Kitasatospora humi TaxID=2893891 RepID=UPI001E633541|nr:papain-like cysteine protease family protein [Kitasatospora humi]MCC9311790.1 C39 family peptidase [Kitasatospora humi]